MWARNFANIFIVERNLCDKICANISAHFFEKKKTSLQPTESTLESAQSTVTPTLTHLDTSYSECWLCSEKHHQHNSPSNTAAYSQPDIKMNNKQTDWLM